QRGDAETGHRGAAPEAKALVAQRELVDSVEDGDVTRTDQVVERAVAELPVVTVAPAVRLTADELRARARSTGGDPLHGTRQRDPCRRKPGILVAEAELAVAVASPTIRGARGERAGMTAARDHVVDRAGNAVDAGRCQAGHRRIVPELAA